jgi:hypothetical protein
MICVIIDMIGIDIYWMMIILIEFVKEI